MKSYVTKIRKKFNDGVRYAGNVIWEGLRDILASPVTNIRAELNYEEMGLDQLSKVKGDICHRQLTLERIAEITAAGCFTTSIVTGLASILMAGSTLFGSNYEEHDKISRTLDNLQNEKTEIVERFDGYTPIMLEI